MAEDVVIRAEGLGKKYVIGHQAERQDTLRDTLSRNARNLIRSGRDLLTGRAMVGGDEVEEFWALRDVDFEVARGEVVGIIGRNGAGKSTLLKILSRITEPSSGRVTVRGRVASLLEVGTGFHPELTGRENIYLNGSILGMSRAEIRRKFDEIVAFAEVDKFLDTPVKRYSSGMYVRLAFAVAAHLEPEILIVDEVLAVGDASFQKKCLGKMEEVAGHGRTVLFVSHNMAAVTRLCSRAMLLEAGRLVDRGSATSVVSSYFAAGGHGPAARTWEGRVAPGNEHARLKSAKVVARSGTILQRADIREPVGVEIGFDVLRDAYPLTPNCHVYFEDGVCAFISSAVEMNGSMGRLAPGSYTATMWIPGNLLSEGMYNVGVALSTTDPLIVHFFEPDAVSVQVVDPGENSARGNFAGHIPGVVRPRLDWQLNRL